MKVDNGTEEISYIIQPQVCNRGYKRVCEVPQNMVSGVGGTHSIYELLIYEIFQLAGLRKA